MSQDKQTKVRGKPGDQKMKALMVGAHDDDALLWMGGTIPRLSDWQWTVLSMRRWVGRERDREYFRDACKTLAMAGVTSNFTDRQLERLNDVQEVRRSILEASKGQNHDYVFTHSRSRYGEYTPRHKNHVEVMEAVASLVQEGKLTRTLQSIVYFAYKEMQPDFAAPFFVDLTDAEVRAKQGILDSPVMRDDLAPWGHPCPNPETFDSDSPTMPQPLVSRRQPIV